jgi:site-specific DNA-methyltransferase (adenine-specific)
MEYLIKTYTNEGETVLDNCAGSFTTGIACLNTGRDFIGIEKDAEYFRIGSERMANRKLELNIQQNLFT